MPRTQLVSQLKQYAQKHTGEVSTVNQFIEFVLSNEDCFQRELSKGHITASCWLLNAEGTKTLFTHHKKLNKWLQLGGHADGDTDPLEVALKEANEESGINDIQPVSEEIFDIDIHLIPENKKDSEHYHYDIRFLLQTQKSDDFIISDESNDLAWFSEEELRQMPLEDSLQRMMNKWVDFRPQSSSV